MARFARGVQVFEDPCLGLVDLIEAGQTNGAETERLLRACVTPMLNKGVDALVLGCTHYPFIRPLLTKIVGPDVAIIDPAPAVARQTARVLRQRDLSAPDGTVGTVRGMTTGHAEKLIDFSRRVLDFEMGVETAVWRNGQVSTA
jgi:glutamate racemase